MLRLTFNPVTAALYTVTALRPEPCSDWLRQAVLTGWPQEPLASGPATRAFVVMHLDMTLRSWLETLGAVGPGHEWAIPRMFPPLMQGIERSVALDPSALEYFRLHIELDVEHGQVLERCLIRWATSDANRNEMRRGALRSLEARAAFWAALAEQLFPEDVPRSPSVPTR